MAFYHAAIHNVYNYYQDHLAPKSASRFDAHKNNDLKKVYRSIVKIEKESPVFVLPKPSDVADYTIHMKESAIQFRNAIASLGDPEDSSFLCQQTVYSSQPDTISVDPLPDADYSSNAQNQSLEVTVPQLALCQKNQGHYLHPGDGSLPSGTYSFDVHTTSANYELQFAINNNDTNLDIQSRLTRLINNSNLGIHAEVLHNSSGDTALSLTSTSTGALDNNRSYFTVSEENTSQQKGIIDYFGIREVTQEPTDAIYTINGIVHHSASNTVQIEGQFEATFHNTTSDDAVLLGTKPDYESLCENIRSLSQSYNSFIQAASTHLDKQPRTTILVDSMKRMSSFYMDTLSDAGFEQNADGTLDFDSNRLETALTEENSAKLLHQLGSFSRSAVRKITQVQLNPMDYVDKKMVAYKNPQITHYANPYVTSSYSGMFFNSYM